MSALRRLWDWLMEPVPIYHLAWAFPVAFVLYAVALAILVLA